VSNDLWLMRRRHFDMYEIDEMLIRQGLRKLTIEE
jgi:hypothetical protein